MTNKIIRKIQSFPKLHALLTAKLHQMRTPYISKGDGGIFYLIYPKSALDYHIARNGIIDDYIANSLKDFIPQDGVIFDIGANVGLLTLPFAVKHVPNGRVFAYEPDYENFCHLGTNIALNELKNVEYFPYAIQENDSTKETCLNIRRAVDGEGHINQGLSSLSCIPLHSVATNMVQATTIDNEVKKHDLDRLDFIKIDVEGAEHRVLLGGMRSIDRFRPIIQYGYSVIIDSLSSSNNSERSFVCLDDLGYIQFRIIGERNFERLLEPRQDVPDSNILCFHESKLPVNMQ